MKPGLKKSQLTNCEIWYFIVWRNSKGHSKKSHSLGGRADISELSAHYGIWLNEALTLMRNVAQITLAIAYDQRFVVQAHFGEKVKEELRDSITM
jgi:hypothetical protein